MIKVGIIGLGFMGHMHFGCWKSTKDAQLVAICDIEPDKRQGGAVAGNVAGTEDKLDLTGITAYADIDEMLAAENLDAVSITLPTHLHAQATIKALNAGVNVLCEKPMARDSAQCQQMIDAAQSSGKILQVGHCIRFWPEYAQTKEILDAGTYGKVLAATFQRLSATPLWSWQGWILDGPQGGGAVHDLHIHDSDFVQYAFGLPQAVFSRMVPGPGGEPDHAVTQYLYDHGPVVTAEGGWMMAEGFGFQMSFHLVLEKATIVFDITRDPTFKICPTQGEVITPKIPPGDGYSIEIDHFARKVAGQKVTEVLTPDQSLQSVKIIEAEKQSAQTGQIVKLT